MSKKKAGRGARSNPPNRFDKIAYISETSEDGHLVKTPTQFFEEKSHSIISRNISPDVDFEVSLNPYRGCEHGCAYCYARPTHEYFGLSSGLDFETKIFVKKNAATLLRRELSNPRWKVQVLAMSGVTDPYQPIERRLGITRQCLEVLEAFRHPVEIITKNALVSRDVDILEKMAARGLVRVLFSVTTLDSQLARLLEPRTSTPQKKFQAVQRLAESGVPVGVLVAPVIPALTDHEIPQILNEAAHHGARFADYIILRLPFAVKSLFIDWLERYFPERKNKVLHQLEELYGGQLYDSTFGVRGRGKGVLAEHIRQLFVASCRKAGLQMEPPALNLSEFRPPYPHQPSLF